MDIGMDTGKNIYNAFKVVGETHCSVDKLMKYCSAIVNTQGNYGLLTPRFLRWKSDTDCNGWNTNSFILLFNRNNDENENDEDRNSDVYVMEIDLYDENKELDGKMFEEPIINLSRFIYKDTNMSFEGCSPTNHWRFYWPLRNENIKFKIIDKQDIYYGVLDEKSYVDLGDKKYLGFRKALTKVIPLVEVTGENVVDKIFGTFDLLYDIDIKTIV